MATYVMHAPETDDPHVTHNGNRAYHSFTVTVQPVDADENHQDGWHYVKLTNLLGHAFCMFEGDLQGALQYGRRLAAAVAPHERPSVVITIDGDKQDADKAAEYLFDSVGLDTLVGNNEYLLDDDTGLDQRVRTYLD